jgi:SAM-dependent methyltransferase
VAENYPYIDGSRAEMIRFIPPSANRILDVGCAYGGFGALVKKTRPDAVVIGVEPSEKAAATASTRLDKVTCGTFPDDAEDHDFDCIVFNDVLEHVVDPWDVLRRTVEHLSPGGVVVASLPNVRNASVLGRLALKGTWTYTDVGILDRTHLRFFTRRSALDMFALVDFDVLECALISVANSAKLMPLALFGRFTEEFRALQIAIVARPRHADDADSPSRGLDLTRR